MLQIVSEYGVGSLGRELSVRLAHRALRRLDVEPSAAFLWATAEYNLADAVKALQVLLGDITIWGSTVRYVWNAEGHPGPGMVLVVLGGEGVEARGARFERLPAAGAFANAAPSWQDGLTLALIEAMQSRLKRWLALLDTTNTLTLGGLVGGRFRVGRPTLVGGRAAGDGGAALAWVKGLKVGLGWGTGWRSSGLWVDITESRGEWVAALNGHPASEELASVFHQPARQWPYAPLRELVRLYPLGIRQEDGSWEIRAPLHVETDGSLRMTSPIRRGQRAYWMVGEEEDALQSAEDAATQALRALDGKPPLLALAMIDASWYHLFASHEEKVAQRLRRLLGTEVPLVGVYTYGQILRPTTDTPTRLLHNHIVVALLADAF